MKAVTNHPITISYTISYDELVTGAAGTQDTVVLPTTLTPGWQVDAVGVETVTAFNGSGARTFDIGVEGNGDAIVDGLDVKGAGIKNPTVVKYRATETEHLVVNLITATDNPTAGVIRVTFTLVQVAREN